MTEDHLRPYYTVPPGAGPSRFSRGVVDVLRERQRQVQQEGWTPEHDDQHADGALAQAAACYAVCPEFRDLVLEIGGTVQQEFWPWDPAWWKPGDRRRDLVKAGALILAEIERLDRLAEKESTK